MKSEKRYMVHRSRYKYYISGRSPKSSESNGHVCWHFIHDALSKRATSICLHQAAHACTEFWCLLVSPSREEEPVECCVWPRESEVHWLHCQSDQTYRISTKLSPIDPSTLLRYCCWIERLVARELLLLYTVENNQSSE